LPPTIVCRVFLKLHGVPLPARQLARASIQPQDPLLPLPTATGVPTLNGGQPVPFFSPRSASSLLDGCTKAPHPSQSALNPLLVFSNSDVLPLVKLPPSKWRCWIQRPRCLYCFNLNRPAWSGSWFKRLKFQSRGFFSQSTVGPILVTSSRSTVDLSWGENTKTQSPRPHAPGWGQ